MILEIKPGRHTVICILTAMGKPGFSISYIVTMMPRGETSICQQHQASLKQYFLSADASLNTELSSGVSSGNNHSHDCPIWHVIWLWVIGCVFIWTTLQLSVSLWTQEEIPISVYLYIYIFFLLLHVRASAVNASSAVCACDWLATVLRLKQTCIIGSQRPAARAAVCSALCRVIKDLELGTLLFVDLLFLTAQSPQSCTRLQKEAPQQRLCFTILPVTIVQVSGPTVFI